MKKVLDKLNQIDDTTNVMRTETPRVETQTMRLSQKTRKALSTPLYNICSKYRPEIPLSEIQKLLKASGLQMVQEDGTPWSGFLCGQSGETSFELASLTFEKVTNSMLQLSWYRLESGNYETVCYLS